MEIAELGTTSDIAAIIGASRQRADQLTRQRDFPRPVGRLGATRLWKLSVIRQWHERHQTQLAS